MRDTIVFVGSRLEVKAYVCVFSGHLEFISILLNLLHVGFYRLNSCVGSEG